MKLEIPNRHNRKLNSAFNVTFGTKCNIFYANLKAVPKHVVLFKYYFSTQCFVTSLLLLKLKIVRGDMIPSLRLVINVTFFPSFYAQPWL